MLPGPNTSPESVMDQILPWIISAIGGAVGGNVVGLFGRLRHLTPVIKTILGAAGGVAG